MHTLKRTVAFFLAVLLAVPMITMGHAAAAASDITFADVNPGDWYYNTVMDLVSIGAVSGKGDGLFHPYDIISAVELASVALLAMPGATMEDYWTPEEIDGYRAQYQELNPGYWGNEIIMKVQALRGLNSLPSTAADFWALPVSRINAISYLYFIYYNSDIADDNAGNHGEEAYSLIGDIGIVNDYDENFQGFVYWAYLNGIVTGVNQRGDFNPEGTLTRAEACTIISQIIHPESRAKIDWDELNAKNARIADPTALTRLADGTDVFGHTRAHYAEDLIYDECRELEAEIGIPIYYLPEYTQKDAGLYPLEWLATDPIHKGYFDEVRSEFEKLKAAYSLYPEGLVKEVVSKKNHPTEIIVTPYYSDPNVPCHGQYIYDESSDPVKVDQIYYTGQGDSTYYSHEIGHMITGSTGHSAFNDKWKVLFDESMLSTGGFVSDYAMNSHLEDIAETWAYLWHHTEDVRQQIQDGDTLLQKKVQLLTEMLDEKLDTFDAAKVPWSDLLEA